jgi:hypothetical protein
MRPRFSAFSLVDLLFASSAIVLLMAVAVPSAARIRELGKRSLCGANLAGIGAAAKVYATVNRESWPIPAFKNSAIDREGIDYVYGYEPDGFHGSVGWRRSQPSSPAESEAGGWTQLSTTRAYWMLVRSGEVPVKQFVCPSGGDVPDPAADVELYYDFFYVAHISYGYLVPFGPLDTRPREGKDHRQILAADKGPWYLLVEPFPPEWRRAGPNNTPILPNHAPSFWRPFNSPNHGGRGSGEGQNVLVADGSVSFTRIPAVGADSDNIYTLMANHSGLPGTIFNPRWHGEPPFQAPTPPYPGEDAWGSGAGRHSTTDSLIYP